MNHSFQVATPSPFHHGGPTPTAFESRALRRRGEVVLGELEFRRLRADDEIATVQQLRSEIRLPVAAVRAADFGALEKKETRRAWWESSNGTTPWSAR